MARARLENLTAAKDGWALLSVTLSDDEKGRIKIDPDEADFSLAIKKIQSDDFLHCGERGFLWGKGEFYFKIKRSKKLSGDLALKISSRLTDNFTENQFFFLLKGENFGPLSFPVMSSGLSRRRDAGAGGYPSYKGPGAGENAGYDEESDPEIERIVPPTGRITNHPDPMAEPGRGLFVLSSKKPITTGRRQNSVRVQLLEPVGAREVATEAECGMRLVSPGSLEIDLPPELCLRLSLTNDFFNLYLEPDPLLNFPADSSAFVKPVPKEPEPQVLLAPRAELQDDPHQGAGWALFTLEAEGEAAKFDLAEDDYRLSVRDPESGLHLAWAGTGFDWGSERGFINTQLVSLNGGVLVLRLFPGLTSRLDKSPLLYTVSWKSGEISETPADASGLTRLPVPQETPLEPPVPVPAPLPPAVEKKGKGKIIALGALLLLVLAALGAFGYFKFYAKPAETETASLNPPEAPPEEEAPKAEENKPSEAAPSETPPAAESPPSETPPAAGNAIPDVPPTDPSAAAAPPEPGPSAPTRVDEAERLIGGGSSFAQMEGKYLEFASGTDPDSLDASYRLLQALSVYAPKYKAVYAEYFDPLVKKPAPDYVEKNAFKAYQLYSEAVKLGDLSRRESLDALKEWSATAAAKGQPGVSELLSSLP
ncbi:MAG: hypothetical protein LBR53_05015 [Deltaproteobacteria bacterium]|jgi:hypothetical protein|nr:hypothetical protein [Deltaproteobacteria bacterium]